MKKQIENLIELAKDYVVFGIELGLPDTHNNIRGGHQSKPKFHQEGDLVSIYFAAKGETWNVTFKNIEITGYNQNVTIPFTSTPESLKAVYDSAKEYLDSYLLPIANAKYLLKK